jgi:hypothetical protein
LFEQAESLLSEAQSKLTERLKLLEQEQTEESTFFSPFHPPADSAMSAVNLTELQRRISELQNLISSKNRTDKPESAKRLADFVMLNPHGQDYPWRLDELLKQMGDKDPLGDNVALAKTKLVADEQLQAEQLSQLHKEFQDTDGGMQALYELARLKISSYQKESNVEQKKKYLVETRALLTSFISLYPDSFYSERAKKNLDGLPSVE